MTVNTTGTGSADALDARRLVLDPDFEPLFTEVDKILCDALAPRPRARRAPVPAPGPRPATTPVSSQYSRQWVGRLPPPWLAPQH
ncbi:hypothetical protein ACFWF7_43690 [Nocardia sp. NPDC060256]|uniref:hypothetical protein n=1 Tax=Nocardia sp. NPDC060256 TaxID=3347086 RepID=UPI00365F9511